MIFFLRSASDSVDYCQCSKPGRSVTMGPLWNMAILDVKTNLLKIKTSLTFLDTACANNSVQKCFFFNVCPRHRWFGLWNVNSAYSCSQNLDSGWFWEGMFLFSLLLEISPAVLSVQNLEATFLVKSVLLKVHEEFKTKKENHLQKWFFFLRYNCMHVEGYRPHNGSSWVLHAHAFFKDCSQGQKATSPLLIPPVSRWVASTLLRVPIISLSKTE